MQRITYFERQIIESGLRVDKSVRAIALSIGRDHRVIQREVERNRMDDRSYSAVLAERLTLEREKKRHRRKLEKLKNADLRQFVEDKLRLDLSPQQVAGLLSQQPPLAIDGQTLAPETIYQYIYEGEGRWENLYKHLRRKHRKRQRRWARKARKTPIPDRISIHLRPEEINYRLIAGHWESDTVEGQKEHLSVQFERKLKLLRLNKIPNKTAAATENALRKSIDSLPGYLWKTITFDNGGEGANHANLKNDYGIETYFCDPYASWQKGGVENINGLIRQYIPKGTDISKLTDEYIHDIQERLNNRPRKSLNYLTPNQVLASEAGC